MAAGWRSEFDSEVDPDTEWTAANIQEALPGLITPMTWSLSRPLLEYAFARSTESVGPHTGPRAGYVANFYGRAFLNLTALRAGAMRVPFGSPEAIDAHYLGKTETSGPGWRPAFGGRLVRIAALPRVGWLLLRSASEIRALERRVAASSAADANISLSELSAPQLVDLLESGSPLGCDVAAVHIATSGGATAAFGFLESLCRNWLHDEEGRPAAVLCSGVQNIESARAPKALWDLARLAHRSPRLAANLDRGEPFDVDDFQRSADPAERQFGAAYGAFSRRFGHRSVMEGELSAPSWSDDPATVAGSSEQD